MPVILLPVQAKISKCTNLNMQVQTFQNVQKKNDQHLAIESDLYTIKQALSIESVDGGDRG